MKKIILIIIILLVTACSKYEELNDLAIISNISISIKNNEYEVTMQEIIPKKENNKVSYEYEYRTSLDKNLKKAFSNIIDHSPKKMYFAHLQNIIIDNKNRDKIVNSLLKYKNNNFNKNTSLVLSNDDLISIMKINSNYKYIDTVLKKHVVTLKELRKKSIKKERLCLPLITKYNKKLIFKKTIYLHSYSSLS